MIWDRGVSIFYGLWQESCQALGPLATPDVFKKYASEPLSLQSSIGETTGEPASDYEHNASVILNFMSQFMTLSDGDVYVMGPLVAQLIQPNVDDLKLKAFGKSFSIDIV